MDVKVVIKLCIIAFGQFVLQNILLHFWISSVETCAVSCPEANEKSRTLENLDRKETNPSPDSFLSYCCPMKLIVDIDFSNKASWNSCPNLIVRNILCNYRPSSYNRILSNCNRMTNNCTSTNKGIPFYSYLSNNVVRLILPLAEMCQYNTAKSYSCSWFNSYFSGKFVSKNTPSPMKTVEGSSIFTPPHLQNLALIPWLFIGSFWRCKKPKLKSLLIFIAP